MTAKPPGKPTMTLWGCEWPDPPENLLLSCHGRAACGWYRYNHYSPSSHPLTTHPCFPPGPGPVRFTTIGTPGSSPTAQDPEVTLSLISDPGSSSSCLDALPPLGFAASYPVLSDCLFTGLSICLSTCPSSTIYLHIPSTYPSVCLFTSLSVGPLV